MKMEENEFVRRWVNERDSLKTFLSGRGHSINDVVRELGSCEFSKFISELSEMGKMLEQAEMAARESKNIKVVGYMLGAGAKIQKDRVYGVLTLAIGEIFPKIDGYVAVLRDYIKGRFERGVKACEEVLESVK